VPSAVSTCGSARSHKTFDLGAYTVSQDGVLLVSDQAHGTEGFQEARKVFKGRRRRKRSRKARLLPWATGDETISGYVAVY